MAAYAALVSLQNLLDQDPFIPHNLHEIESLQESVDFLLGFLHEFPDDAGAVLEGRMRSAASEAGDIIEGWISDEYTYRIQQADGCLGFLYRIQQAILSVFPSHRQVDWQKLVEELQGIMKELEIVADELVKINNCSGTKDQISGDFPASSSSSSSSSSSGLAPSGQGTPVGLEQLFLKIKQRICYDASGSRVIWIVGMGGIGKTTLAKYLYDDPEIVDKFEIRTWVTISHNFVIKNIILAILGYTNHSNNPSNEDQNEVELKMHLLKFLYRRRYLIVLDDTWDIKVWDALRHFFPNYNNGSRIIITSRNLNGNLWNISYEMNLMEKSHSWDLLREKVFAHEDCPPELEQIGKLIAEKCGGLPLRIVMIAQILSKANRVKETWEHIARNFNEIINTSDEKFMESLSLSYKYLPHHLRSYFLYIGGFPEDYEINVSKLLKFWIAEGLLKSKRPKYDLEKVAEEYLKELIERHFVLVTSKSNGKIKTIKIHDAWRDFCLKTTQNEKFLEVENNWRFTKDIWSFERVQTLPHFSNYFRGSDDPSIQITICPFIHGVAFMSRKSFKRLKILDAFGFQFNCFPNEIGELLQLRYLAITLATDMAHFEVPSYLSKLQNLQTLIILPYFDYPIVFSLPFRVWRLPQLRHLILSNICFPNSCKEALTTLENLLTLSRVAGFTCCERILKLIPHVQKLKVFYLFNDVFEAGWSKYKLNNLVHFHILETLNLEVGEEPRGFEFKNYCFQTLRISDIAFPLSLKKLTLKGCKLPWKDLTIIGALPNLEVLKLKKDACCGDNWETTKGEFRWLKVLILDCCDPRRWMTEESHFPRLRSLVLLGCQRLEEIPYDIGYIATLGLIALRSCRPSIEESAKRIQDKQMEYGDDDFQVQIFHPFECAVY